MRGVPAALHGLLVGVGVQQLRGGLLRSHLLCAVRQQQLRARLRAVRPGGHVPVQHGMPERWCPERGLHVRLLCHGVDWRPVPDSGCVLFLSPCFLVPSLSLSHLFFVGVFAAVCRAGCESCTAPDSCTQCQANASNNGDGSCSCSEGFFEESGGVVLDTVDFPELLSQLW